MTTHPAVRRIALRTGWRLVMSLVPFCVSQRGPSLVGSLRFTTGRQGHGTKIPPLGAPRSRHAVGRLLLSKSETCHLCLATLVGYAGAMEGCKAPLAV